MGNLDFSDRPSSIGEVLCSRASSQPDNVVYTLQRAGSVHSSITYRELDRRARKIAVNLRDYCEPNGRVLILLPHGLDYILTFFGSVLAGLVAVPSFPAPITRSDSGENNRIRILRLVSDCSPQAIVATEDMRASLFAALQGTWQGHILTINDLDRAEPGSWTPPPPTATSLCHLQYTSGSTSSPRAVMVSHSNLLSNLAMIERGFGFSSETIGVSWLPFFHDMGLANILSAVYCGFSLVLMSPSDFIKRPFRWLKTISDYAATASGGPNFAYDLCLRHISNEEMKTLDLRTWSTAFNGSEPVRAQTLRKFSEAFTPCGFKFQAFRPCYGLAEATVLASISSQGSSPKVLRLRKSTLATNQAAVVEPEVPDSQTQAVVGCGHSCLGQNILIVEPQRKQEVADSHIGEIWISGPNVAIGYWNQPLQTELTFNAKLKNFPGSYLRTGDLGFKLDGELFITGRLKELLIFRGKNYFPQDIELLVAEVAASFGVENVAAFSIESDGEEVLSVVAELSTPLTEDSYTAAAHSIRLAISAHFDLHSHVIGFVEPRTLPISSSGKLQRLLCKDRFSSDQGQFLFRSMPKSSQGNMLRPDIDPIVKGHAYLFKHDGDPHSQRTLEEMGLDSLDLAQLAFDLERRYPQFDHQTIELSSLYKATLADCYLLLSQADITLKIEAIQRLKQSPADDLNPLITADSRLDGLSFSATSASPHPLGQKAIFLTGATGFVGSFILAELLSRTNQTIALLVRSQSISEARERIERSLREYRLIGLEDSSALSSRVKYFPGDLEKPRLGLSESDWKWLSEQVATIFHNGANVNYISTYPRLRSANVLGTRQILELAACGRGKFLHYISSTFIFGWAKGLVYENTRNPDLADLDFGYSQSKWAAEQLVWQAQERGLQARIYRPAMLSASSNEQFSTSDVTGALLLYFINHQVFADMPNQISLMPVDFFARRMVDFASLQETDGSCFHFTMKFATLPQMCRSISEQFGYTFQPLSLEQLSTHLRENCRPDDLFFPFVNFYHRHFRQIELMMNKRYMRDNYEATCRRLPTGDYEPSINEITRYIVRYFQQRELIRVNCRN